MADIIPFPSPAIHVWPDDKLHGSHGVPGAYVVIAPAGAADRPAAARHFDDYGEAFDVAFDLQDRTGFRIVDHCGAAMGGAHG